MFHRKDEDLLNEEESEHTTARWLPPAVVIAVLGGFGALAWYAYHAGMESMKDEDLLVVEAEKTPIKEKPLDPGGMQFPNQDKTIFDTFAANGQQPPKVERVLPPPEEPLPAGADTFGTTTWVNDKLHKDATPATAPAEPEQVIGDKKPAPPAPETKAVAAVPAAGHNDTQTYVATKPPQPAEALDQAVKPIPAGPAAPVAPVAQPEPLVIKVPQEQQAPAAPPAPPAPKVGAKPAAPAAATTGGVKIQLGAYRSDQEARAAWGKIQKNQPALAGKQGAIYKADLGAKGTYYRLRVGGFATAAEAKAFCGKMTGGQACMVADK